MRVEDFLNLFIKGKKMKNFLRKIYKMEPLWVLALFILIDVICIGMGMGVPFFCILLGIPVGWFLVLYVTAKTTDVREVLWKVLIYAAIAAGVTVVGMLIIWISFSALLFEPGSDLSTVGMPLILYQPRASLIGWLALMIIISPVMQLLTTLFGAYLTLLGWLGSKKNTVKA
jgi:hypothetical protein